MVVGVVRETFKGERRVALVPAVLPALIKSGWQVLVEAGAGAAAGFPDRDYTEKGARLLASREEVVAQAEVVLIVRQAAAGAGLDEELAGWRPGQVVVGQLDPLGDPAVIERLAACQVTAFALELLPRISRAQSMDVLSSMATVAGYKAVLLAAVSLPRLFPMLMTAAGTVTPARLLVLGAGVAGLQAIATARRLGAVVSAYDVRPAARREIESLGARAVELPLEAAESQAAGGYARAQEETFYRRQQELLADVIAEQDVVITTAAVPGKRAPILITRQAVSRMASGSVVVDLAAERGGNCELTRADETVVAGGVTILGPTNLPATVPYHASQLYAKNVSSFLLHVYRQSGQLDLEDPIVRETLVARDGRLAQRIGASPAKRAPEVT